MRCAECPAWQRALSKELPCQPNLDKECDVGPLYLRHKAARHRLIAKALDQAAEMREAEMREREEAQTHA